MPQRSAMPRAGDDVPPIRKYGSEEKYERVALLGRGASGAEVYIVRKREPSKPTEGKEDHAEQPWYACKVYDYSEAEADAEHQMRRTASNELSSLMRYSHSALVQLIECFQTPTSCSLVLIYLGGRDLKETLDFKGSLAEEDAKGVTKCVLQCLAYLHSHGVAHRDVKLANIMFEDRFTTSKVRLVDLGLAKQLDGDDAETADLPPLQSPAAADDHAGRRRPLPKSRHSMCGTGLFAAPEVLTPAPSEGDDPGQKRLASYTTKADVWSCGVVLFMLLSGAPPFSTSEGTRAAVRQIRQGAYNFRDPAWHMVSSSSIDLVKKMLTVDSASRPTAAECLGHPWLANT